LLQRSQQALAALKNPLVDAGDEGLAVHDLGHGFGFGTDLWDEHRVVLAEASVRTQMLGDRLPKTVTEAIQIAYPYVQNVGTDTIADDFNIYVPMHQRRLMPEVILRPWLYRLNHLMKQIQNQLPTKEQYLAHLAAPIHSYADRRLLQKLGAVRVPRTIDWNP
jgi:hypothetical protein